MMRLSFNINKLISTYFPELLRKAKHQAWLEVSLSPLALLWANVLAYRTEKLYEATITGETNRLVQALKDKFNTGIYIVQPLDYLDTAWVYLQKEPQPEAWDWLKSEAHTPVEYDYLDKEYSPAVDFVVRVPTAAAQLSADIKKFLAKYVLAGKRYKIEIY